MTKKNGKIAEIPDFSAEYAMELDADTFFNTLDPVLNSYAPEIQIAFGFIFGCFVKKQVLTFNLVREISQEAKDGDRELLQPALLAAWRALIDLKLIFPKETQETGIFS